MVLLCYTYYRDSNMSIAFRSVGFFVGLNGDIIAFRKEQSNIFYFIS